MNSEFDVLLLGQQFSKITHKKCEMLMHEYDLRKVELDILYFIAHCGEHNTAKDILINNHISKAHISKSVDNLKSLGYINLDEDKRDHRCFHISIAKKAEPILDEYEKIRRELLIKLFRNVTDEEKVIIQKIVNKISKNINDELQGV